MLRKADILIKMAVDLGIADYDANGNTLLPSDPANLRRIREAYEDGRTTLWAEDPRFAFSRPELDFALDPTGGKAIGGDASRYALPYGVIAPPLGRMTLEYPTGTAGRGWDIVVTSWATINNLRANSTDSTGAPTHAGFILLPSPEGDKGPRYEMRLNRSPDLAYVLRAPFQVQCVPLDDQDVDPTNYPLAVKAYALWEVQRSNPIPTGPSQGAAATDRDQWLQRVVRNENARTPRNLGHSAKSVRSRRRFGNSERNPQWQEIPTYLSDGTRLS
jgi:hypothetical protein